MLQVVVVVMEMMVLVVVRLRVAVVEKVRFRTVRRLERLRGRFRQFRLFSFFLLLSDHSVASDQDVDVKRSVEGAADAEVQHAAAQDEERALKAVLVEKVLD